MDVLEVTRLSSKGQVVIPRRVRDALHLSAGAKFMVLGEKDTVILKKLVPPTIEQLRKLMARAEKLAASKGATRRSLSAAIARAGK